METHQKNMVRADHPMYKRVVKIAQNIVNSNQEYSFFQKQKWTVIVVEGEEENAFVIPVSYHSIA